MGDRRMLQVPDSGFPRSEEERRITKRVAEAKTREEYVAAVMSGGAAREDAESAADWVGGWTNGD